jgi:hypothetical protein
MSVDHSVRDHSVWSASASARNFACAGALRLTHGLPSPESEASAWGTAAHQISEKCLRTGVDAVAFLGTTETTKSHQIEVDDELAETAQVYVDYVRDRMAEYKAATGDNAVLVIEQRFSLARINPPFEAGGTGDAVLYFPLWFLLEIVDLKGGRGVVVEAKGNKQERTYSLGAMLENSALDVRQIMTTIVQPRAPHRDGRIRSETFHVADLMEWTAELLGAMKRSKSAWDDYGAGDWDAFYLNPGNHCASTFCPARATCPAVQKASFEAVGLWFDDVTDKPHLHNTPDSLMPEQIAALLDAADMVEGYLNAVRAYAHSQAESGVKIPNYDLYPKQARRKFKDGVTAQTLAEKTGRAPDEFLGAPKLLTPAQTEKVLGKDKDKISGLWSAESSGTNLCRSDKTTRTAAKPKVEQHFDILN